MKWLVITCLLQFISADIGAYELASLSNVSLTSIDVECLSNSECTYFLGSSCKTDPRDLKKRCLCGDTTPPRASASCGHSKKGIDTDCDEDEECIDGAVCQMVHNPGFPEEYKSCQCIQCFKQQHHLCVWDHSNECIAIASASTLSVGFIMFFHSLLRLTEIFNILL